MQIGCTILFRKIRYNLLCWHLDSIHIAGKQDYLPSGFRECICLVWRKGMEWCTRSVLRQIRWRYILDISFGFVWYVNVLFYIHLSVVFKCSSTTSATWLWLRAESSVNALRNASGCKQRFDTCQFFKNKVPHYSRFVGCLVAESQLRDIDYLLSIQG